MTHMKKPSVVIVRGKFLNRFDMQSFAPLSHQFRLTAVGSLWPLHDSFPFPVVKLLSPMDLPNIPYKMPILNRLFVDAHYLFGLERVLRGVDLVHTAETYYHYTQQSLEVKKRGLVKKVIATVWETIPGNNEGIWGRRGFKARARLELDHVIAVTQKAKAALIAEGMPAEKISVLGAHIDTKRFAPAYDLKTRLGDTKKRTFTLLFCGRLEAEKGVLDLVEAVSLLGRDKELTGYECYLRFVGQGSLKGVIETNMRKILKNWHSTIESATYDQMPKIYQEADIFIAPSKPTSTWEEQYGMALLEAQSAGLPIVTTSTGGIPENVGNAAVVVPPGNPSALASALKDFLVYPQSRMTHSLRARRRALAVHDVGVGAKILASIYDRVLRS